MTFEEALTLVEAALNSKISKPLTPCEKQILKAAWDNDTYSNVSESLYLSIGHVKDIASLLWQRISDAYGEKITKNNFRWMMGGCEAKPKIFEKKEKTTFNKPRNSKDNILIVDDQIENLHLLTDILAEQGYQVRSVPNRNMALKTIRKSPPDVIVIDIKMSEMDGYQLCQTLKSDQTTSEIPVIFLTERDEVEVLDQVKVFEPGGIDYITKPFQPKQVLARIQTQLVIQQQKHQFKQQIEQHQETIEILSQSRALLANLLNSSKDGIAALQAERDIIRADIIEFRCLLVNQAFAQLLGQKREDLMGKASLKKLLNQLSFTLFDSLVEVVETGETLNEEFYWENDENQHIWYELIAVKFGEGCSITVRDITRFKINEFQLKMRYQLE